MLRLRLQISAHGSPVTTLLASLACAAALSASARHPPAASAAPALRDYAHALGHQPAATTGRRREFRVRPFLSAGDLGGARKERGCRDGPMGI